MSDFVIFCPVVRRDTLEAILANKEGLHATRHATAQVRGVEKELLHFSAL